MLDMERTERTTGQFLKIALDLEPAAEIELKVRNS